MNSKRKDLQYASVFLLAVALTFLMGKGDNLWLVSWGDLIPSLFVLFIAGDCLHSGLFFLTIIIKIDGGTLVSPFLVPGGTILFLHLF